MRKITFLRTALMAVCLIFSFLSEMKGATYTLCTSTSDLVAGGKYIIASRQTDGSGYVMGYQNTNNRPQATTAISVSSGIIVTTPATVAGNITSPFEITLGGTTGAWTFQDPLYSNNYLKASSNSSNYLVTTSGAATWTISFSSGDAVLTCTTGSYSRNILRYNSSSLLFSCYSSGLAAVYLYKLVAGAPVVSTGTPTGTVGSPFTYNITATGAPTSYAVTTGTLPAGLSLNTTTGAITGTPTAAGSPVVGVTATNTTGTSPEASLSFTINKGSQSITFGTLPLKTTADADFAPGATSATSGINPITYASTNSAVATIVDNKIHIVGAGQSTITASQASNDNYNAATSVDQTLSVSLFVTPQTITFNPLDAKTYGDANFDLTASTTSGLTISYASSNTAVATVSGATVTIVGPGSTTITASQAGDSQYNPATSVDQTLLVNTKALTLPDAAVTPKTYDTNTSATITGTLTGIIGSDVVTLVGTGTYATSDAGTDIVVTSTATLGGANAAKYTLTQPTGLTGTINKASQTITFGALSNKSIGDADFAPGATSITSNINPITYVSSNTNVATIVSGNIHIVGAGTTNITASQGSSDNYDAATDKIQSFTVTTLPILAWQFGSPAASGSESTYDATTNNSNLEVSTLSRGTGISSTALGRAFAGNGFSATGTKASAVSENEYFQFAVKAKAGFKLFLSTLDATIRRSGTTAPNAYIWKYSLDGTSFTEIGSDVSYAGTTEGVAQPQIDLSGISELQNVASGTTVTFRIFAWGGTSTTATFSFGRYATGITTSSLSLGGTVDIATQVNTPSTAGKVFATKGQIVFSGISEYVVYNAQGVEVANAKATSDNSAVALRPGIYVVKSANKTTKVVVR